MRRPSAQRALPIHPPTLGLNNTLRTPPLTVSCLTDAFPPGCNLHPPSPANMALRLPRALAIAALSLSLSCVASASRNYSSVDMIRAQLDLLDDRPKDCPPWYGAQSPPLATSFPFDLLTAVRLQLQLQPPHLLVRPICTLQRIQRQVRLPARLWRRQLPGTSYAHPLVPDRISSTTLAHLPVSQNADLLPAARTARYEQGNPANATKDGQASTATCARPTKSAMP